VSKTNNLWQSPEWKRYQESLGREVRIYESTQVVIDKTVGGYSTWEIIREPSAPIDNEQCTIDNLFNSIIEDAKNNKCMALYFSPASELTVNCQLSIVNSVRHQQPEATRIIDLTKSEDEILAQMKQKGRYNIKVATKHGVTVRQSTINNQQSTDIDDFYNLIQKTAKRDRFKAHSKEHYKKFLENLDGAFMLLAFAPSIVNCQLSIVAGLIGVIHKNQGIYYYGASSHAHRNLMAPYLLQWEAIKYCKDKGCDSYDLFGIAPPDSSENHPWKGVSAFKEKFGGDVVIYPEEKMILLKPLMYKLIQIKRKLF
jgi:hypothetical protein|tara:strand:+ start:1114 stop:2049 length:936 start_codon:yes stop_codon:yes gene_type:complete